MKNFRLTVALLLLMLPTCLLFAQQSERAVITGMVTDESTGEPLAFANVSVLSPETMELQFGGTTEIDGAFEIPVRPGVYTVKVQFLSYREVVIKDVTVSEESPRKDLGQIGLEPNVQMMSEVEVVGEKSRVQMGLDKRVFNVEKDLSNTGGSVTDLLENIPSVSVDVEGNVALRGSQSVRILINGKPSGLLGVGENDGLQLLQSNLVKSVEIITNPGARYDAEGSAGIINIILKKQENRGVNGSFDVQTGYPHNHSLGVNLNLRRDFVNLFGNLGVSYRQRNGGGGSNQNFLFTDTTYFTERDRDWDRTGFNGNVQVGADFFLGKETTLTTSFLFREGRDNNESSTFYRDFDADRRLVETSIREDDENEDEYTLEYNLAFEKKFEDKDHKLTADIQYQDNSEVEDSDILEQVLTSERTTPGADILQQRSLNDESERRMLIQADYVRPSGKDGKFEAGYRSTLRRVDNDYLVEEFNDASKAFETITELSNVFDYNENVHAVYSSYGNKIGDWSFQVGLRGEHTDIRTELVETNEVNNRDFFNLFPSAFLTYEFSSGNNMQVSYSRRIRRPNFWLLNPFFSFSDDRNIRSGNPNLLPEYTNSYELSYIKYWDIVTLSSAIYYRHTTDVIDRTTSVRDDGITISMPRNLLTQDDYGFEFNVSSEFGDWWRLNSNLNLFRSVTDGGDLGEEFSAETFAWSVRTNSKMTLWEKLDWQLQFNYRGPRNQPQGRRLAIYSFDTGFGIDVLNGSGSLNLNVRDIFNTRRYRFETVLDNFISSGDFQWVTTTVTAGFTYRLNQKKGRGGGRRGGGYGGGEGY